MLSKVWPEMVALVSLRTMIVVVLLLALAWQVHSQKGNGYSSISVTGEPEQPRYKSTADYLPCSASKRNTIAFAIESYWRQDTILAYSCACTHLQAKPDDGFARSIVFALTQGKQPLVQLESKADGPAKAAPPMRRWEVLGPIGAGKLEHDADSTFLASHSFPSYPPGPMDVGAYLLGMPSNASVLSDLAADGTVRWSAANGNEVGEVGVAFPGVRWNDLVQGLSNTAVYEFQAWARTTTFVHTAGSYLVTCSGAHTVYVRNERTTRVLVADVYRSGRVSASVDLRVGLVGLAVPLRGVGQTSFACQLEAAQDRSIAVQPAQNVPDLLEFPELPGRGYLLSSVFTLPVHNLQNAVLSVDFTVDKPLGQDGEFFVRAAKPLQDRTHAAVEYGDPGEITIAPGQTMYLSLELIPVFSSPSIMPFLSCRKNKNLQVTVLPSRGPAVTVTLEIKCRRLDQSFTISYLDHDHTVSQAAVIFPRDWHSSKLFPPKREDPQHGGDAEEDVALRSYPVLLTMHGSGIPATNHADAHKVMLPGQKDYTFGADRLFVLAPSRFGAHNWEHTGERSALQALHSLHVLLRNTVEVLKLIPKASAKGGAVRTQLPLPQVRLGSGIVSGHSMGAHGAWMLALNHPDLFSCLAPLSGWINKEEYGTANAFFQLDASSSFVDPQLREIMHTAMSDTHADKLMENVRHMDVLVRVGAADATTHPWYSRRTHRLLMQLGINSTFVEVPDKQHWWWDTDLANDGGVLNDPAMQAYYAHCQHRAIRESALAVHNSSANEPATQHLCQRSQGLVVINPAASSGRCGLRILQQQRQMSRTSATWDCTTTASSPAGQRTCTITTRNVRKLEITASPDGALTGSEVVKVDGLEFNLPALASTTLCWTEGTPGLCAAAGSPPSPLLEKSLVNYGPVRWVSARPLCIVYGTPKSHVLRQAIRDLAVYVANAHAAAYGTHVRVLSDLDYIASKHAYQRTLSNLMFIGGPSANRLMSMICGFNSSTATTANSSVNTLPLACRIPDALDFQATGFAFEGAVFDDPEHSAVFTLPFYRVGTEGLSTFARFASAPRTMPLPSTQEAVGMAVCLHANSVQGYMHLSRLAWPVVPPMVRAPFETYIPDYLVLDGGLWSRGMGAAMRAGYWDNQWRPASGQSFVGR